MGRNIMRRIFIAGFAAVAFLNFTAHAADKKLSSSLPSASHGQMEHEYRATASDVDGRCKPTKSILNQSGRPAEGLPAEDDRRYDQQSAFRPRRLMAR